MIHLDRCWTGRRWINIGRGFLAVGFGPNKFVERIHWRGKLVWYPKYRPLPSPSEQDPK
jgi:hypothetical protein